MLQAAIRLSHGASLCGFQWKPGGTSPLTKANNTKLFSVLAYFSVLWLVGLLADPDNPKVRFHVNRESC